LLRFPALRPVHLFPVGAPIPAREETIVACELWTVDGDGGLTPLPHWH